MVTGQIEETVCFRAPHPAREVEATLWHLRQSLSGSGCLPSGAHPQLPGPSRDPDALQLAGPLCEDLPSPGRGCGSPRGGVYRGSGDAGEWLRPGACAPVRGCRSHPLRVVERPPEEGRSESPSLVRADSESCSPANRRGAGRDVGEGPKLIPERWEGILCGPVYALPRTRYQ
jgi:hypothetical protein